jgi:hypothetical protein
MVIRYARVSAREQDLSGQLAELRGDGKSRLAPLRAGLFLWIASVTRQTIAFVGHMILTGHKYGNRPEERSDAVGGNALSA